jgi:TPR repeat protein
MAFYPIKTAPKNEELIALVGESGDVFEVARWSFEKDNWVGKEGEPIRIKPTYWFYPNPSWLPPTKTSPRDPNPSWLPPTKTSPRDKDAPRRTRLGLYAGLLIIAGSAMLDIPWVVGPPSSPQRVPSQHVASAEMANLPVRTAAKTPGGIENAHPQTSGIEEKQGLEQARPRADALVRDLAYAPEQLEAVEGQVTRATAAGDAESVQVPQASTEQEQALEQESRRSEGDLASARAEVEALKARAAAPIVARNEPPRLAQAAHAAPQAAAPPTTGFAALRPESVGRGTAADPQTAADTKSSVRGDSPAAPAREQAGVGDRTRAVAPPLGAIEDQIALWVKRGEDVLAVGDFVSARVLFQRAAEAGGAQAALMLAATYDPKVVDRFRADGLAADIAKAQLWYEKAKALGSREAARRLQLLGRRAN